MAWYLVKHRDSLTFTYFTIYILWDGRAGFDSWVRQEFFSLPPRPDWLWSPPSSYRVGAGDSLLGDKATGSKS